MRTFKEWRDGCPRKKYHHLVESSDYEDGDVLRFWYIVDQDSRSPFFVFFMRDSVPHPAGGNDFPRPPSLWGERRVF